MDGCLVGDLRWETSFFDRLREAPNGAGERADGAGDGVGKGGVTGGGRDGRGKLAGFGGGEEVVV